MITREEYLADPCGTLSIPYRKAQKVVVPVHMRIVHEREFQPEMLEEFDDEPYFRLMYDLRVLPRFAAEGCLLRGIDDCDVADAVRIINACYADVRMTEAEVMMWRRSAAFWPDSWVMAVDAATGLPAGCVIAEYDEKCRELTLEWVQVLPEFRGRGFGRAMVCAALARRPDNAAFATVSGRVKNGTNPEGLYRACGFTGNDVWHILTKKQDTVV